MTEAEEAAHILGDPRHRREFVERAALELYKAIITANYTEDKAPPGPGWAAKNAALLFDCIEAELAAREKR